jgi:hypothetical protein
MPEISRFYGIVVRMYWDDHPPPHFHAQYGDMRAKIEIGTGRVLVGRLPGRAQQMLQQWELEHRSELVENWKRATSRAPLAPVPPLR